MPTLTPGQVDVLRAALVHGVTTLDHLRSANPLGDLAEAVNQLAAHGHVRLGCSPAGALTIRPGRTRALAELAELDLPDDLRAALAVRITLERISRGTPCDGTRRIARPEDVASRVDAWRHEARERYWSIHHGPPPREERLRAIAHQSKRLVARGVEVTLVYSAQISSALKDHTETLRRCGVRVALARTTTHRIVIVDRHHAVVVPTPSAAPPDGAVFIERDELVSSFATYAGLLTEASRCDSDLTRRTVQLMASGLKDAAAAKELGVTDRQFRRYVACALTQLGASSRFQAGVRAARAWGLT